MMYTDSIGAGAAAVAVESLPNKVLDISFQEHQDLSLACFISTNEEQEVIGLSLLYKQQGMNSFQRVSKDVIELFRPEITVTIPKKEYSLHIDPLTKPVIIRHNVSKACFLCYYPFSKTTTHGRTESKSRLAQISKLHVVNKSTIQLNGIFQASKESDKETLTQIIKPSHEFVTRILKII